LATTPWTRRKPLPLGPIHLVGQDAVLVGILFLGAWLSLQFQALTVPLVFLAFYLAAMGISLALTGQGLFAYGVGFGLGLVVRLAPDLLACTAAALGTYAIVYVGLRRSLADFPWDRTWLQQLRASMNNTDSQPKVLGWPFGRLGPRFPSAPSLRRRDAILISLLVGWWVHVIGSLFAEAEARWASAAFPLLMGVGFGSLIRLALYCSGYLPPISGWGRIRTGCWIVRGYDQVFVAPILAVSVAAALTSLALWFEWEPGFVAPVVMTLALVLLLGVGPELTAWRLTGNHRIVENGLQPGSVKVG
jgi:hypothetical protein